MPGIDDQLSMVKHMLIIKLAVIGRDHHAIDRRVVDRIRCRRAHPDARIGVPNPSLPLNVSAIAGEYEDTQIAENPDQPTAPAPRTDDGDPAHASADWRTPASPSVRRPAVITRMEPPRLVRNV